MIFSLSISWDTCFKIAVVTDSLMSLSFLPVPTGKVTFHRQVIKDSDVPKWSESQKQLPELHVASKGWIEDEEGLLQVCLTSTVQPINESSSSFAFVFTEVLIIEQPFHNIWLNGWH